MKFEIGSLEYTKWMANVWKLNERQNKLVKEHLPQLQKTEYAVEVASKT